jgi:UDPglucose 6-dehydrogenase
MDKKLSLVGLGKLGLCLAACYADVGIDVLGIDIEERVVDNVNKGISPIQEPKLDELIWRLGGKNLRATTKHAEAIEHSDITIILVATPSNPDGSFSNRHIESSLQSLSVALKNSNKPYHLFVISSTVMPGSTNEFFIPIIEKFSGRKLNEGFGVVYDPDFVALGNVVNGFKKPDIVVLGESAPECGEKIEELHRFMCENNPKISRMSIISAEIAKVCLNAYITTKITFANSVANLCEKIDGSDVDAITESIGWDRRISPYYFRGGLSFGGTCFPRDTKAYIALGKKYKVQTQLINSVEEVNSYQDYYLTDKVFEQLNSMEFDKVGIMGLSFVPNTPVITESPAIKLIEDLIEEDIHVIAYDKLAIDNTKAILGSSIEYVHSPESLLEQVDLLVITLKDTDFKNKIELWVPTKDVTVIDCWRILDKNKLDKKINLIQLGVKN